MGTVEVVVGVQQRRRWSAAEKRTMVKEAEQPGMSISAVARKYGIHANQLFSWRKLAEEGALSDVGADEGVVPASEVRDLKKQIRELERLLGRKTMEVEILKEAVRISREKKTDLASAVAAGGRYPMKTVADTLSVSRSRQYEKREKEAVSVRSRYYRRKDDATFLVLIRQITDDCPTYGYRRVTALINRQRMEQGLSRMNPKRIYCLVKMHGLLLPRYSCKPTRTHDGRVIMTRSNLRWCSDSYEIACWTGELIRLAFSMDCCDREVMSYVATTGGISGDMIRDLMAQAFVKTFKRDYVHVYNLADAVTVMKQLPGWFNDYNEKHPHKGLKMM